MLKSGRLFVDWINDSREKTHLEIYSPDELVLLNRLPADDPEQNAAILNQLKELALKRQADAIQATPSH
jgi:hypothetical protein